MRDSYRAEPDQKLIGRLWLSVIGGMSAGAEDATGLDDVEAEALGASDDLRRFSAGIEPELTDGLALKLLEQTETNGGRYVEAHLVECCYGKGVEIRKSAQALNFFEDGVDRKDGPTRVVKCANGLVPEFAAVGAGANDGDRLGGHSRGLLRGLRFQSASGLGMELTAGHEGRQASLYPRLVRCATSDFGYNGIDPESVVREDGWN
jgi:hypothetical protein